MIRKGRIWRVIFHKFVNALKLFIQLAIRPKHKRIIFFFHQFVLHQNKRREIFIVINQVDSELGFKLISVGVYYI